MVINTITTICLVCLISEWVADYNGEVIVLLKTNMVLVLN